MIVGALRLPLVIEGMIDELTTRSAVDADHPGLGVDDRQRVARRTHLAGAGRMVGALGMLAHEIVDRLVADAIRARQDFAAAVGIERLLREDLAREPDAGAHIEPSRRDGSYS